MKDGKYALGIVGLSERGMYFGAEQFPKAGDCYVSCVCDLMPERVQAAVDTFQGTVRGYTELDAFLQDPDLDVVLVATSDRTHKECAVKVLQAGKHLYLEKPMAQSIEDCDAIIDAWYGSNTVFMVGLELRYCTLIQECRRLMDEGAVGRVILATVVDNVSVGGNNYFHGPRRREAYIKSLMLEKGTHSLDLACWLMDASPVKAYCSAGLDVFGGSESNEKRCPDCGQRDTCPYAVVNVTYRTPQGDRIESHPDKCVYARECDVADNGMVLADFDSGARMTYLECHFTPEYSREFMFIGDRGKLTAFYNNEQDFKIMLWKRFEKEPVWITPPRRAEAEGHGGGDWGIIREFFRRVKAGKPTMDGVIGARDSAAIAIAAHDSAKTGLPVEIPRRTYPAGTKR